MSNPFSTPPRGGRGGRGASTPSPPAPGRGRGMPPGFTGGGRGIPDPFGTPPQRIPNPAAWSSWSSSSSEGRGGGIFGIARRGGRGGRGGRGSGAVLSGLFSGHATTPGDDPFGGSTVAGGTERQDWLQRARESFSDESRFMVEKMTITTSGMLLRVVDRLDVGRFVVKAGFPGVARTVARERNLIHRVRFARHIVKWLKLTPDPMAPGPGNAGFSQPYFFLEYLENGTLGQFQKRIQNVGTLALPSGLEIPFLLPNRLLWSIFLCLIRACVGMAWPPDGPEVVLEVPAPPEPSTLAHMDMHNDNVMFGDLEQKEAEHTIVPIAKLIDLGDADERPAGEYTFPPDPSAMSRYDNVLLLATYRPNTGRRNQGIDKNILDVGVLMANLIANQPGFVITCQRNMMDTNIHPYLDRDLRVLIQRCLAVDPENRPRLEELIDLVGRPNSPFFRDEKHYKKGQGLPATGAADPAEELETDDALNVIIQTYILNADLQSSSRI
ncbi:hypothetical protein F4859DRAFT_515975 [Xylaria cf. heliscus]|nr:hypothetical protein F4859DRAFT_515975 [Xylaria cf. heliscus]